MRKDVQVRAASARKGLKRSAATRELQSVARIAFMQNGGSLGKGSHYTSPKMTPGTAWLRSSWELRFASELDKNHNVLSYDYERVQITYQLGGVEKITLPDFLVTFTNGAKCMVEVKPLYAVKMQVLKIVAMKAVAQSNGWDFLLLTEHGLSEYPQPEMLRSTT